MSPLIENVSDTARWVAMYRAIESARPDALFHDPFAARLAGERGERIVAGMPGGRSWGWPMVVRTVVLDEIVQREVAAGVDRVVNLAAGLDMRPYRLNLPATLQWFDVDLPAMTTEKEALVRGETPHCRVTRLAADLADPIARRDVLAQAMAGASNTLVITEGLLIYLREEDVVALARDLASQPSAKRWLTDISAPILLQWMANRWGKVVAEGGAPFRFAPEGGPAWFEPHGWRQREFRGTMLEAARLKRQPPGSWLFKLLGFLTPSKAREQWARVGFVLLERD